MAAISAAVFIGLGKGGVPIITALAVPILALVMSPVAAAGMILPVYLAADAVSLVAYRRDFKWPVLRIMLIALPLGVLLGYLMVGRISEAQVTFCWV